MSEAVDPVHLVDKLTVHLTRYLTPRGTGIIVITEGRADGHLVFYDASAQVSFEEAGHWVESMLWAWINTGVVGLHAYRDSQPTTDTI